MAELIWSCWDSIDVSDILSWTDIYNVDSIGMCMMEGGVAKLGVVEKNVGGVVDFAPLTFAHAIHFLILGGSIIKLYAKVGTFGNKFYRGESCSSVGTDETDRLC